MNKSYLTLLVFVTILLFFIGVYVVQAQGWDPVRYGGYGLPEGRIYDIVEKLMLWILSIIGIVSVIAFAVSGIQYMTSAGDESRIEIAKKNMKWSIIGVITALAGLIVLQEIAALLDGCVWILFFRIC